MKLRWKIAVGAAAVVAVGLVIFLWPDNRAAREMMETREKLRAQGFKTELSDFNFFTTAEFRERQTALTNAGYPRTMIRPQQDYWREGLLRGELPKMMATIDRDAALVAWKTEPLPDYLRGQFWQGNFWTAYRSVLEEWPGLDEACAAALSGPIRFHLNASDGTSMLLAHVSTMRSLSTTLGKRMVLELHDGNQDAAWTNLLAATRLVTAWEIEPVEVSHLVRFACTVFAFDTTWQALQARNWTDAQLATLQREWESADFLKGLPETAAFAGAVAADACQDEREQPRPTFGITWREALRSPRHAWYAVRQYREYVSYRNRGSYEDEKMVLLAYQRQEQELKQAVQHKTWSEIRLLPAATNDVEFQSKYNSGVLSRLRLNRMSIRMQGEPGRFIGRAAETEARRRVIITAIALERHRLRHGAYPATLAELSMDGLNQPQVDFMDGQPLRYRLIEGGAFVLYSIGLDGEDNGGTMPEPNSSRSSMNSRYGMPPRLRDIVWPRPATAAEMERFHAEAIAEMKQQTEETEEQQSQAQWKHAAARQAHVEKILSEKRQARSPEPKLGGEPLSAKLANSAVGTNTFSLGELLTPRQLITGAEPEVVTFDVPIQYDTVTNLGELGLFVDPADIDSDTGSQALWCELKRATNGNCLLVWNTIYEAPGKHALMLGLTDLSDTATVNRYVGFAGGRLGLTDFSPDERELFGPPVPFALSNICEFSITSATFNPAFGGTMRAKLPEMNATYTIQITLPGGEHVRTLSGSTTNGVITAFWDLTDDAGKRRTNNEFASVFRVTLTDSGRTQTMKGP